MEAFEPALEAARRGDHQAFADLIAPFRRELRALCYRMAGSIHDVDLFQDAMLRDVLGWEASECAALLARFDLPLTIAG